MDGPEVSDIAIEHRRGVFFLAGAVAVFATAGLPLAFYLGEALVFNAVILLAGAIMAALILIEPIIGLCLMVILIPVEEAKPFFGGWLTPTRLVGVATFASLLVNTQFRRATVVFDKQSRWGIALALWMILSLLWAEQQLDATLLALTVAQLALFWVLIRALVGTSQELLAVSVFFMAGTILAIVLSAIAPRWGMAPRLIYTQANPNHLARDIVVSLVLLLYYAPRMRSRGSLVGLGAGGVLILGLLLTQSRSGWIEVLICSPLILLGHKKVAPLVAVISMSFLAVVLFTMGVLSKHLGLPRPPSRSGGRAYM